MAAEDVSWALDDLKARQARYQLAVDYDLGNHRLLFATEKFRNTFGDLFREFADNFCDDALNAITDRLQITGWTAEDKALKALVDSLWERTRGEARTGKVFRHGYREGDGFTIVQENADGTVRSYAQNPATMCVRFSALDTEEMEVAAKVWRVGKRWRLNLYYPDKLERWASKGSGSDGGLPTARAFTLLADGDPLLQAEQKAEADMNRIPVFHYPNGDLGGYGRSLLAGVIPLQDAFNKSISDMLVAMEEVALPGRWATGVEVERDSVTGRELQPFQKRTPGSMYRVKSKEAAFGQFPAASMDGFLDVQDALKIEIARKGLLPPHAVTLRSGNVQYPSGVSLVVAEGRTLKATRDKQRDWGVVQRREMAYMLELQTATTVYPEDLTLQWAPPETRDEQAALEMAALKRDLGVPDEEVLQELGYSDEKVTQWLADREQRRQGEQTRLSVLQGGRGGVSIPDAIHLERSLGIPPAPVPPNAAGA